jgi:uncharacterized protein YqgQ
MLIKDLKELLKKEAMPRESFLALRTILQKFRAGEDTTSLKPTDEENQF